MAPKRTSNDEDNKKMSISLAANQSYKDLPHSTRQTIQVNKKIKKLAWDVQEICSTHFILIAQ